MHTGRDARREAKTDAHCFVVTTVLCTLSTLGDAQCNIRHTIGVLLNFHACEKQMTVCQKLGKLMKKIQFWKYSRCRRQLQNVRTFDKQRREIILMCCLIYQCFFADECNVVPARLWWVHPMNIVCSLPGKGEFHAQVQELKCYPNRFLTYFQMHSINILSW